MGKRFAATRIVQAKLTAKQRAFIDAYLGEARGNATKAAEIAGYRDPGQSGYENKKKLDIWREIERRLKERTLASSEVLDRLSEHANATLLPFLRQTGDSVAIDLSSEAARAHIHLLKKVKVKQRSGGKADQRWEEIETEVELHDPQAALVQLGRHHKLFTDRLETPDITMTDEEKKKRLAELIAIAMERAARKSKGMPS